MEGGSGAASLGRDSFWKLLALVEGSLTLTGHLLGDFAGTLSSSSSESEVSRSLSSSDELHSSSDVRELLSGRGAAGLLRRETLLSALALHSQRSQVAPGLSSREPVLLNLSTAWRPVQKRERDHRSGPLLRIVSMLEHTVAIHPHINN